MHATVKGRTIGKIFTKWAGGLVAGCRIWCGSGQDVHSTGQEVVQWKMVEGQTRV